MLNKVEVTLNMAVVLAVSGRGMPQIVQCESTERGLHEQIFLLGSSMIPLSYTYKDSDSMRTSRYIFRGNTLMHPPAQLLTGDDYRATGMAKNLILSFSIFFWPKLLIFRLG